MIARSDPSAWLEVLAQLHPLVLHFPVAIVSVLAIVEVCGIIVRRPFPRAPLLLRSAVCCGAPPLARKPA